MTQMFLKNYHRSGEGRPPSCSCILLIMSQLWRFCIPFVVEYVGHDAAIPDCQQHIANARVYHSHLFPYLSQRTLQ